MDASLQGSAQLRPRVLIVDDEVSVRRMLARLASRISDVSAAAAVDEARSLLERGGPWTAVIVDWRLGARLGSEVLDLARANDPLVSCALLAGAPDHRASEAAWTHGVPLFVKPLEWHILKGFIVQAIDATSAFGRAVAEAVQRWRLLYGFRPASAEVLRRRVMGEPPTRIVEGMGIAENTYKKHIHNLLECTRGDSIEAEAARLLRDVAAKLASSSRQL